VRKTESIKERRVEVYLDTLGRKERWTEVTELCANECLGSEEMDECARLCRDVADVASLHARFMARDSACGSREIASSTLVLNATIRPLVPESRTNRSCSFPSPSRATNPKW